MRRPVTKPAFTPEERERAHRYLAAKVAFMMGRKFEEGDWASVYCRAKGIPVPRWSNLKMDIMHNGIGVEHKMYCYSSKKPIEEACGQTLMHPAATRQIRPPSTDTDPNAAMRDVFQQYAQMIERRREDVAEVSNIDKSEVDLRSGWLLWQASLRQFLYFEEELFAPDPEEYWAEWNTRQASPSRRGSTNLWIYDKETNKKRFSVTTEAGAKIQPYFDVPAPSDKHLYVFTVIGETIDVGHIRLWVAESTARDLGRVVGTLETESLSAKILEVIDKMPADYSVIECCDEVAVELIVTSEAYLALQTAFSAAATNDDSLVRRFVEYIRTAENGMA